MKAVALPETLELRNSGAREDERVSPQTTSTEYPLGGGSEAMRAAEAADLDFLLAQFPGLPPIIVKDVYLHHANVSSAMAALVEMTQGAEHTRPGACVGDAPAQQSSFATQAASVANEPAPAAPASAASALDILRTNPSFRLLPTHKLEAALAQAGGDLDACVALLLSKHVYNSESLLVRDGNGTVSPGRTAAREQQYHSHSPHARGSPGAVGERAASSAVVAAAAAQCGRSPQHWTPSVTSHPLEVDQLTVAVGSPGGLTGGVAPPRLANPPAHAGVRSTSASPVGSPARPRQQRGGPEGARELPLVRRPTCQRMQFPPRSLDDLYESGPEPGDALQGGERPAAEPPADQGTIGGNGVQHGHDWLVQGAQGLAGGGLAASGCEAAAPAAAPSGLGTVSMSHDVVLAPPYRPSPGCARASAPPSNDAWASAGHGQNHPTSHHPTPAAPYSGEQGQAARPVGLAHAAVAADPRYGYNGGSNGHLSWEVVPAAQAVSQLYAPAVEPHGRGDPADAFDGWRPFEDQVVWPPEDAAPAEGYYGCAEMDWRHTDAGGWADGPRVSADQRCVESAGHAAGASQTPSWQQNGTNGAGDGDFRCWDQDWDEFGSEGLAWGMGGSGAPAGGMGWQGAGCGGGRDATGLQQAAWRPARGSASSAALAGLPLSPDVQGRDACYHPSSAGVAGGAAAASATSDSGNGFFGVGAQVWVLFGQEVVAGAVKDSLKCREGQVRGYLVALDGVGGCHSVPPGNLWARRIGEPAGPAAHVDRDAIRGDAHGCGTQPAHTGPHTRVSHHVAAAHPEIAPASGAGAEAGGAPARGNRERTGAAGGATGAQDLQAVMHRNIYSELRDVMRSLNRKEVHDLTQDVRGAVWERVRELEGRFKHAKAAADQRGMGAIPSHQKKELERLRQQLRIARREANQYVYALVNARCRTVHNLDLHGMQVVPAVDCLQQELNNLLAFPGKGRKLLVCVTGRGKHAQSGVGAIRNAVQAFLRQKCATYWLAAAVGAGHVIIELFAADELPCGLSPQEFEELSSNGGDTTIWDTIVPDVGR